MIFRKLIIVVLVLASALMLFSGCDVTKRVKNEEVEELVSNIKSIEGVGTVEAYHMGFELIIDICVKEAFTKNEGMEILNLCKKSLKPEVVEELSKEFEQEEPPDVTISIRYENGKILMEFIGSYYDSYKRSVSPAYDRYHWRVYKRGVEEAETTT